MNGLQQLSDSLGITRNYAEDAPHFRALSGQARPSRPSYPVAKLPQDFEDLLVELCEAKAEFLLVGGWAVILHGHVRATDDMDVFVRPSQENSLRVTSALKAFGAPLAAHGVTDNHFAVAGDAYRFGVAPLKVEVLTKISGSHSMTRWSKLEPSSSLAMKSLYWQTSTHPEQEVRWAPQGPGGCRGVRAHRVSMGEPLIQRKAIANW